MNNQNILKDIMLKSTTMHKKRIQMCKIGNFHIGKTDVDDGDTKQNWLGITFNKCYPHFIQCLLRLDNVKAVRWMINIHLTALEPV